MDATTALASTYLAISAPIGRRGFRTFMSVVNRVMPSAASSLRTVDLQGGAKFLFPSGDPYYQYYFLSGEKYEEELQRVFEILKSRLALCLDCGANFGYWSVLLSRWVKTVAVEASSENFALLQRNNEANDHRFSTLQAAITDADGEHVWFATKTAHAGRNITTEANSEKERVSTVTVDELVRKYKDRDGAVFVKLDVEGVEVEALKGSKETLRADSAFFYEDHAKDRKCLPTAYLLGEGKRVYHVDAAGRITPILRIEDALKFKIKSKGVGYNFIALGDLAPPLS